MFCICPSKKELLLGHLLGRAWGALERSWTPLGPLWGPSWVPDHHTLAHWNDPLQSLVVQKMWVHPYTAVPMLAAAQCAWLDLERSRAYAHFENKLYPMIQGYLQEGAIDRVRREPKARRGIDGPAPALPCTIWTLGSSPGLRKPASRIGPSLLLSVPWYATGQSFNST